MNTYLHGSWMHNKYKHRFHTYVHTYIRYIHTYIHTHIHEYMHTYIYTHKQTYVRTYIHMYSTEGLGGVVGLTLPMARAARDSHLVYYLYTVQRPWTSR